jgi:hypothetical protein
MTQAIAVWFEGESVMHTTEIPTTYDGIGITGSLNQHGPGAIRCVH